MAHIHHLSIRELGWPRRAWRPLHDICKGNEVQIADDSRPTAEGYLPTNREGFDLLVSLVAITDTL